MIQYIKMIKIYNFKLKMHKKFNQVNRKQSITSLDQIKTKTVTTLS